jgi:ketosteroid isomerase-like protein
VSREDVELVRRAYGHTEATKRVYAERFAPGFVWEMSGYDCRPERQRYDGVDGAQRFLDDWSGAWDDWRLEIEDIGQSGDKVVVVVRQSGRARATGMDLDMVFAQIWRIRDGWFTRMDMYFRSVRSSESRGLERLVRNDRLNRLVHSPAPHKSLASRQSAPRKGRRLCMQ